MGFFDDVVDIVTDTAEESEKGAEWVGEVVEKLGLDKIVHVAETAQKHAERLAIA